MSTYQILVLTVLSLFAFGCSKQARLGIDPASERKASSQIVDSFTSLPVSKFKESGLAVDQARVEIKKSALEKEFLLSTNIISQTPTPAFSSLQSRVVMFVLRDGKVYLLDVTGNNRVGLDNIPQTLLLAEFDIFSDKVDSLVIDFNTGMKKIFLAGDMFASDDGNVDSNYKLPTAKINLSYLEEVSLRGEALFIRQIAQIETESEKRDIDSVPVEVRYQIKPYLPDASFIPVKSPGFTKVGYFEANPLLLKDGTTLLYANKWNEKKTIVFSISANTPEKYRELVKSGVLYWNKILGANAIRVKQLTDKADTAPAFDKNIIQWVDYDGSGAAFADMHIDPRSGEVTSAQVFFPSAFTESLVPKRVRLNATRVDSPAKVFRVGLKGFTSARVCNRQIDKDLANIDLSDVSAEAMDKALRDYVYEVIAHEVGHVMGLRHNFAGSLASNYDWDQRKDFVMDYYRTMKAPSLADGTAVITSSSVMEYSRFEESSWNGDRMRRSGTSALTYDEMALGYLYLGKALPEDRPIFCTDSQADLYADCSTSDAGRSIVSAAHGVYQFNLNTIAARMLNLYITKSKYADDVLVSLVPVSEVDLNAKTFVKTYGNDFAKLISLLKADIKLIAVRSAAMPILTPNLPALRANEKQYLQSEFNRLGGLEKLTEKLPADFDLQMQTQFNQLLEDPFYNSGVGRDGQPYQFSPEEKQIMKNQFALFSTEVMNEFILNELKALSGENFSFEQTYGQSFSEQKSKWDESPLVDQLATVQLKRFEFYGLSHAPLTISTEVALKDGSRTKVELPTYLFSQNIRLASANLFLNTALAIDWAYAEKQQASDMIENEISILGDEAKIDKAALPKDARRWLLFNKEIESTLGN